MEQQIPTEDQIKLVQLLSNDKGRPEIAFTLGISVRTVENRVKELKQIWGLKHIHTICLHFYKNGWVK